MPRVTRDLLMLEPSVSLSRQYCGSARSLADTRQTQKHTARRLSEDTVCWRKEKKSTGPQHWSTRGQLCQRVLMGGMRRRIIFLFSSFQSYLPAKSTRFILLTISEGRLFSRVAWRVEIQKKKQDRQWWESAKSRLRINRVVSDGGCSEVSERWPVCTGWWRWREICCWRRGCGSPPWCGWRCLPPEDRWPACSLWQHAETDLTRERGKQHNERRSLM